MKEKLLLLHGALGSKQDLAAIKVLLSKQYDCYDMNFEGHGGRSTNRPFSIASFSENVVEFLSQHSLDQVSVFGYSMGGYVALYMAIHHPARIRQVLTLGTKFDWNLDSARQEVKMLNPDLILEKVPQFAQKLEQTHQPNDWKEVMQMTADMMIHMGEGARLEASDLAKIAIPVSIGIGSKDRMVSFEESEWAAKHISQSQLITLEGVRHEIDRVDINILESYIDTNLKPHRS